MNKIGCQLMIDRNISQGCTKGDNRCCVQCDSRKECLSDEFIEGHDCHVMEILKVVDGNLSVKEPIGYATKTCESCVTLESTECMFGKSSDSIYCANCNGELEDIGSEIFECINCGNLHTPDGKEL